MSMFTLTIILSGIVSQTVGDSQIAGRDRTPRPYHEIYRDVRRLLRAESTADTFSDRGLSIRQLADLYVELKMDPRLKNAPTLRRYQAMLWSRLTRVKKELERELNQTQKAATSPIAPDQSPPGGTETSQATAGALAAQLSLVSYSMGGPARVFAQAGAGNFAGGTAASNAADLIALIHRVISPASWDVHGGQGTIIYFAPLHVLVVRATSHVHDAIGGALGGLRKAGP